jgi:hypothetical protein
MQSINKTIKQSKHQTHQASLSQSQRQGKEVKISWGYIEKWNEMKWKQY